MSVIFFKDWNRSREDGNLIEGGSCDGGTDIDDALIGDAGIGLSDDVIEPIECTSGVAPIDKESHGEIDEQTEALFFLSGREGVELFFDVGFRFKDDQTVISDFVHTELSGAALRVKSAE